MNCLIFGRKQVSNTTSDKVYQLLARGRWFSLGTRLFPPQTGCHDIAEILLKVALSTINE
jgi:hypothetical protein